MASREFRPRNPFVLRLTLLALCVVACTAPQQAPREWNATLHVTGGFAGVDRSLDVKSDGQLTATDRRADRQVSGRVPARELPALSNLIANASLADSSRSSACRDCFQYEISVRIDGKTGTARTNDTGAGPLQPLVRTLISLLNRALSGELAR